MSQVFNLTARQHESRILARFGAERAAMRERQAALLHPPAPKAGVVHGADSQAVMWGGIDWSEWVRGRSSVAVTEDTARSVSAVVACTNLIGGSIASLPLHIYRRTLAGRERVTAGRAERLWWLLNERPHVQWSAAAFWQYLSDSRLFHGDAFARIRRAPATGVEGGGDPISFEPWNPARVDVERREGERLYFFWPADGGRPETVREDDVLHIPGPGFDGLRSMSQLRYSLLHPAGIAYAADQQAAALMADGARPDFALEVPGNLDPEQRENLRRSWNERHSGQGSKKAPVILAGGIKLHQLTMNMEDAELVAVRGMQVEEVCRVFGVPPWMVGHTEKTTSWGSGIEQQAIGFVTYTLQRHLVAFEQELNHKLFKTARNFCEFVTAGLMRGDTKSRYEAYRIALGRAGEPAWMRPSEVRKLENLPPDSTLDDAPDDPPSIPPPGDGPDNPT